MSKQNKWSFDFRFSSSFGGLSNPSKYSVALMGLLFAWNILDCTVECKILCLAILEQCSIEQNFQTFWFWDAFTFLKIIENSQKLLCMHYIYQYLLSKKLKLKKHYSIYFKMHEK
jgi:hypothetical protein